MSAPNVHATAIAVAGHGILIRGLARSGKSSLALSTLRRAEALGREAALVGDDQVFLSAVDGRIEAFAPPASIAGLIEISGVGIIEERFAPRVRLDLVVDLTERQDIPRLPEVLTVTLLGIRVRRILLPARAAAFGADVLNSLARPR